MTTKKSAPKKSSRKTVKKSATPPSQRWSSNVHTDSTHPGPGLFLKSPRTIAKALASKEVSPKGPASGMRMLNFYINRAGKNLSEDRIAELEKAKEMLSGIISTQKGESNIKKKSEKTGTKKAGTKKTGTGTKKSA